MFGMRRMPLAHPSLLNLHIGRPIIRISLSLVLYRVPRSCSFTLAKRSYRMDSGENDVTWCTEPHHSSWQCKESYRCCCHGPPAPLAMGDSGTSTILPRYESMWLRSLHQSERTTARDSVHQKRWTYPCFRAVNKELQQMNPCPEKQCI